MTPFPQDIAEDFASRLRQLLPKAIPSTPDTSAGNAATADGCSIRVMDVGEMKGRKSRSHRRNLVPKQFDPLASPEKAERVAAKGGSDFDIARSLGVDETTLMIWLNSYSSLEAAVEKGRARWQRRIRRLKRPPCPRCGGFVDETIELFGEAFSIVKKVPRCLICGKRFYWTMTPVPPRVSMGRKR